MSRSSGRSGADGTGAQRRLKAVENGQPAQQPNRPPTYGLIEGQAVDQQQPDGTILRIPIFHVMDEDGGLRALNTPNGPVPIVIAGLPIPIGRGLIVPAGPLPKA